MKQTLEELYLSLYSGKKYLKKLCGMTVGIDVPITMIKSEIESIQRIEECIQRTLDEIKDKSVDVSESGVVPKTL